MRVRLSMLSKTYVNLRLRNKFIIPMIIVMFMLFLIFTIYLLRDQRTTYEISLQEKAERITDLLISSNLKSIWDVDLVTLERNCLTFFEDEELVRLVIIDIYYGEDVLINFSKKIAGTQDIVRTANFNKGGKKIAELEVVFTNYYIEQNLAQMKNTLMSLSVLVFILMIGLITVVSQIALLPLKGLMDGVQHLTAGELTFRIPLQSQDELGKLAVSFNTMAQELNLYHDHLQERVEQRTAELTTANAQLHQEIAERKRVEDALRASEAELRALFAGMTDVVLMLNRAGRYLKIAPTSPELLYKPVDELLGTTLHETFSQDQADIFLEHIHQSLETQQLAKLEYSLNIGVSEVWFDGRIAPMSPDTVVLVARDITERKQMEDDLRHAKDAALEAQRAAEAASRAKSTFLANMSHELRTPLHSILGFAQQLGRDATLTASQHQSMDIIYRNGDHLLTLLNDILDFTKIEAKRLELRSEQFALPSLIRQLADMAQLNAEHKGLSFVYEAPADLLQIVLGDQKRLRQILINLLGNAVKFTKHGSVTFKILDCRLQNADLEDSTSHISHLTSHIKFQVEDTGIGIPSEQCEAIFQPFQQADPYKLQEGNTGLGLAISQRLLKMMGSQLYMTSTEGRGSTFWFDLELPVVETLTPRNSRKSFSPPEKMPVCDESIPPLLTLLPADWIATLRQAAEESDIAVLFEVITRIRERDPGLAAVLMRLAEDFEYDEILAYIQHAEQQGGETHE